MILPVGLESRAVEQPCRIPAGSPTPLIPDASPLRTGVPCAFVCRGPAQCSPLPRSHEGWMPGLPTVITERTLTKPRTHTHAMSSYPTLQNLTGYLDTGYLDTWMLELCFGRGPPVAVDPGPLTLTLVVASAKPIAVEQDGGAHAQGLAGTFLSHRLYRPSTAGRSSATSGAAGRARARRRRQR
jgi:hypothetical protein